MIHLCINLLTLVFRQYILIVHYCIALQDFERVLNIECFDITEFKRSAHFRCSFKMLIANIKMRFEVVHN